jgi:hypothetical protein
MDRMDTTPLEINIIQSTNGKITKTTKHKYGMERVEEIVKEISETVICNMEFVKWSKKFKRTKKGRLMIARYPRGFYRSHVLYNGQETWSAFYHEEQANEMIRKMAWHIFQRDMKRFKRRRKK